MRPTPTLIALLTELKREDLDGLAPNHLQRLADLCQHVKILAEQAAAAKPGPRTRPGPRTCGVLAQLRDGERCP